MTAASTSDGTKELLVKAAKRLFSERGFAGTTVREIADAAGVNLSLVSYHFTGKEGLYRHCIEQFGKARLSSAERLLQSPRSREDFLVRLEMFLQEMLAGLLAEPELTRMVLQECEREEPLIADIFRDTLSKVFQMLWDFIKVSQKQGIVDKSLDPMVVAGLIVGMLNNAVRMDRLAEKLHGVSLRQEKYREKFMSHLLRMTESGVVGRPEV